MDINPADPTAIQPSMAHEFHHFDMRNGRRSMDATVGRQKLVAAPAITDEQLSRHKFVRRNIVKRQQPAEFFRIRALIREEANPDGGVDQDHLGGRRGDGLVFPQARHIFSIRLTAAQRPQTFVSGAPHQCFQAQPNGFGVRQGAGCCFGRVEEFIVDVQRLLHRFHCAISAVGSVWLCMANSPLSAGQVAVRRVIPIMLGWVFSDAPYIAARTFTVLHRAAIIREFRDRRRRQVFA